MGPAVTTGRTSSWGPYCAVVAALSVTLAASGVPSPAYSVFQQEWSLPSTALTLAYAVYGGGVLVALLTVGGVSDRVGRRPVLISSLILLAGAMLWLGYATDLGALIGGRILQGVATGALTGAAGAALAETHPRSDLTSAAAVNSLATSLAIALGALFSGALLDLGTPLWLPFASLSAASAVVAIIIFLVMPQQASHQRGPVVIFQRLYVPRSMRREFAVASLCVAAAWSVGGLYLALGGRLAHSLLGVEGHLVAGTVILAVQGVGAGVQFVWIKTQRGDSVQRPIVLAVFALSIGIVTTAVGVLLTSPLLAIVGALVSGCGFGLAFMLGTRLISLAAPAEHRSDAMAAYFVVAYAALSIPALGVNLLAELIGQIAAFVTFAVTVFVLCATASFLLLRPQPQVQ
ncbi:MFS transporter [Rathayibacter toxicus]|uniref:MFS transporter n=1 Tax=Rathayibacter toxicus TaxID=145458 RepID=UPI000CE8A43E|nr:MFS transporter [Rathayibacter toxicus]PPI56693.1 hypothetical protein C5D35_00090 [Rathayibacter toxicus]QOD10548.1 MFS transporter [Rathayibacter toxicus]QWL27282.1 MFS transporter [Rathayibacter toxicus]QWL31499.1 MFS transporter [Rathayibacter toxicus]QWL33590.1 MFS transporter [Rathayibacter toxicus]